jgi:ribose transport system permease protein
MTAAVAAVSRLRRVNVALLMPYLYVLALGLAIYNVQPALIDGPGAVDVRAAAVFPLALVAFGQTLALFTRGVDLAVGGIISTTTAVLASSSASGGSFLLLVAGVLALGAVGGLINGVAIAYTGLQPFIVTLATWSIWGGIALVILPTEGGTVATELTDAVFGAWAGVPKSVWLLGALVIAWLWLRHTNWIQDLRAIGSDEERARLIGVPIRRRLVQCYVATALLAVIAGLYIAGQTGSGAPTAGNPYILNSIAAVVIGGTSIFGGTGSAAASVAGAVAFLMIPDLVTALELDTYWSVFFQGALLIVAVTASSVAVQIRVRRGG